MAVKQVHLGQALATAGNNMNAKQCSNEKIQALKMEVEVLRKYKHKNIVKYIGAESTSEFLNIFLEFVPGGSIQSMLKRFGAFPEPVVKNYTKQILEGLEYLHANHVVHRDIKGANILVDEKGTCKLADFGSAKMNIAFYEEQQYNSLRGTVNFMAPEVIKQKGSGRFADIWSLGCTVFEMLTGQPPWSQFNNQIYALMHIANAKQGPQIPNTLSKEAQDFLQKCLQIDPKKRWNVHRLLKHPFIVNQQISQQYLQNPYETGTQTLDGTTDKQFMQDSTDYTQNTKF